MASSSRAPAPPPLTLGPVRAASSPLSGTPRSAESITYGSVSDDPYASPTSTSSDSTSAPLLWGRRASSGPASHESSGSGSSVKRPVSPRKVNANSYCGRHSDEYLFGGKGLGDLWRAVTKK
ncbi:hypothetical protein VTK56DRAFT_2553 [Thermocarpiscus australiensis]